ncbi:hypothetical protein RRG08_032075 [Elysia crispata]|uniref:Uncharacterized protein n=1 Tax=Elysia crispata TaxID=231223 RepID=A0AAE0ZGU7_9GAST|nr:hypothetical protein RRG08_032075 [Elysia crispata]
MLCKWCRLVALAVAEGQLRPRLPEESATFYTELSKTKLFETDVCADVHLWLAIMTLCLTLNDSIKIPMDLS